MMESNFQALRGQKATREKRNISLTEISRETGLSANTLKKLARGSLQGIKIETLEALCLYFDVSSVAELIEFKKPS